MILIPAIDIIEGKCVRLAQGDFNRKTIYDQDPLEIAMRFEDAGIQRLHLVDLDGARSGSVRNWKILEQIAGKTSLSIDFSGGISSNEHLSITFNSGADFATIGSVAVHNPDMFVQWVDLYGSSRFIVGADVRDQKIVTNGWNTLTPTSVFDHIRKYHQAGITQFLCTDIKMDGLLGGTSLELYRKILEQIPLIRLIASGGIGSVNDLHAVRDTGCDAVIIGRALYENRITLPDLQKFQS